MHSKQYISRRAFLAAGAAGALAAASGCVSKAPPHAPEDAIRIGLIGCGRRGAELLARLCALEEEGAPVRVAAVCDVYAPHLARAHHTCHASAYRHWEELLERENIDGVIIATPDHWHAAMTLAAIQAGRDVYCEAPMALDMAGAQAVASVAAASACVLQVGAQQTSEGQWHSAARLIRQGEIGRVRWAQASHALEAENTPPNGTAGVSVSSSDLDWDAFLGDAPKCPYTPDRFVHWRRFWDYSNGAAAQQHYQQLAPLLLAVGAEVPVRVSAAGGIYARDGRETPDALMATLYYASGHSIVLATSTTARASAPIVRGEESALVFRGRELEMTPEAPRLMKPAGLPHETEGRTVEAELRPDHLENWLACIRTRETCVCGPELGCATQVAVSLAMQAFREEKTLEWAPGATQPTRALPRCFSAGGAVG